MSIRVTILLLLASAVLIGCAPSSDDLAQLEAASTRLVDAINEGNSCPTPDCAAAALRDGASAADEIRQLTADMAADATGACKDALVGAGANAATVSSTFNSAASSLESSGSVTGATVQNVATVHEGLNTNLQTVNVECQ